MKNKEKMPGFTAEAALDKASQSYSMAGLPGDSDSGVVLPQLAHRCTLWDALRGDAECLPAVVCIGDKCFPVGYTSF